MFHVLKSMRLGRLQLFAFPGASSSILAALLELHIAAYQLSMSNQFVDLSTHISPFASTPLVFQ